MIQRRQFNQALLALLTTFPLMPLPAVAAEVDVLLKVKIGSALIHRSPVTRQIKLKF